MHRYRKFTAATQVRVCKVYKSESICIGTNNFQPQPKLESAKLKQKVCKVCARVWKCGHNSKKNKSSNSEHQPTKSEKYRQSPIISLQKMNISTHSLIISLQKVNISSQSLKISLQSRPISLQSLKLSL